MFEIVLMLIFIAAYAWLDDDDDNDPVTLARPSLERLESEAQQALAELRALDGDQERP